MTVCEWCGQTGCDCRFEPVDECPPMCDCGGDDRPRPAVTVLTPPARRDCGWLGCPGCDECTPR